MKIFKLTPHNARYRGVYPAGVSRPTPYSRGHCPPRLGGARERAAQTLYGCRGDTSCPRSPLRGGARRRSPTLGATAPPAVWFTAPSLRKGYTRLRRRLCRPCAPLRRSRSTAGLPPPRPCRLCRLGCPSLRRCGLGLSLPTVALFRPCPARKIYTITQLTLTDKATLWRLCRPCRRRVVV